LSEVVQPVGWAMTRIFLLLGAIIAGLAVAFGAFGAHALSARIPADRLETFEIAVRYQMYHALALLAVAWMVDRYPQAGAHVAGWLFLAGIIVFSSTLYGIAFGGPRWLGAITRVGGLCFLFGWLVVAIAALRT
jgi:uncharacterized membrane protein YgdD (TMEM256/DUF423 family)